MKTKYLNPLLLGGMVLLGNAYAKVVDENPPEPEVRIEAGKNVQIEEYRVNGQVYMIKVIPKKGPPYYLVDADGDGEFDIHRNDLSPNLKIPSWVLFRW